MATLNSALTACVEAAGVTEKLMGSDGAAPAGRARLAAGVAGLAGAGFCAAAG